MGFSSRIPNFSRINYEHIKTENLPQQNEFFSKSVTKDEEDSLDRFFYDKSIRDSSFYQDSIPGCYPYTRGPYASMYTDKVWTIRQYAGFSTAEESNSFYRRNLEAGQKGLSIAFDLPTHLGYDSDDEIVAGDVGMAGVAVDSIIDMDILFDGIPLDQMSVSMTMNGAVLPILALYIVAAQKQSVSLEKLTGTIQNDILKEFMVRNTYIYPPDFSMRIVSDIFSYTSRYMPRFNPISVSGYHIQEAGAAPELELAYTLANGLEYVRCGIESGLDIDSFAPRLSFFWAIGMNFFVEIAKLRAARLLWAELMKEFKPKNPRSQCLRAHCQTSGWSLSSHDTMNNISRTMLEAMAAVCGQTQSLHTNALDEALALPTDFSARIARNTQLYLQHETAMTDFIDPWGGSYCIETLTANLVKKARKYIHEIEEKGGMIKAIANNIPQQQIEKAAIKKQAYIDSGKIKIIGVNCYHNKSDVEPKILKIDNKIVLKTQKLKLKKLRQERNQEKLDHILARITLAAAEKKTINQDRNLLALCVEAVKANASIGEITKAIEKIYKRFQAEPKIHINIYKENINMDNEQILDIGWLIELFKKRNNKKPHILVAKVGQDGHDRGQKVVASAMLDLGFEVTLGKLFQSADDVVNLAIAKNVDIIGISSLAGGHLEYIRQIREKLEQKDAENIHLVVGGIIPKDDYQSLYQAGVITIIPPDTPVIKAAQKILRKIMHHNMPVD